MPFVLSDTRICDPHVPLHWKPVLDDLVRFFELESQLRESPDDEVLVQRIQCAHDDLVGGSNELLEPIALADLDDQAVHQIFARAMFLTVRIAQAVVGDDEILDTADCRTLRLYKADFLASESAEQRLRDALSNVVDLSDEQLNTIEATVERDVKQAHRKHKLVRAIRDYFGLWESDSNLRQNIFAFFETVYPHTGLVAEEVELIVSGTMIFFCLPFEKDELTTKRYRDLPEAEQTPTREFLKRVNRFSQWQFAHFPVFGFRRGEDLDSSLLNALAERSELELAEVMGEIATLTAIIPITEVDKFVVHDIYGHSWQACMLNFDDLYRELAAYADPLDLSESAKTTGNLVSFRDCFVGVGDSMRFDEQRFRQFTEAEVAERLPAAMTPVLAETLADVAEFKLVDLANASMATSSALASFPAKLDLTMRDIAFYFSQATKVFRLWANKKHRQTKTVDQLVASGATRERAEQAVQQAVELWRKLELDRFNAELRYQNAGDRDDQLEVNVVSRLALNFLAIHRETLRVYERLSVMKFEGMPIKGMRDLMLISIAVFFEQSPSRNLWRVDEFLTFKIEPLCEQLAAAMASEEPLR